MARIISAVCLTVALFTALALVGAAQNPKGKATYERLCASCHGADGRGNPEKAAALKIDPGLLNLGRAEAAKLTRDELRNVLLKGKDKMPAYERKLKPAEVDPLLDYASELAAAQRK